MKESRRAATGLRVASIYRAEFGLARELAVTIPCRYVTIPHAVTYYPTQSRGSFSLRRRGLTGAAAQTDVHLVPIQHAVDYKNCADPSPKKCSLRSLSLLDIREKVGRKWTMGLFYLFTKWNTYREIQMHYKN